MSSSNLENLVEMGVAQDDFAPRIVMAYSVTHFDPNRPGIVTIEHDPKMQVEIGEENLKQNIVQGFVGVEPEIKEEQNVEDGNAILQEIIVDGVPIKAELFSEEELSQDPLALSLPLTPQKGLAAPVPECYLNISPCSSQASSSLNDEEVSRRFWTQFLKTVEILDKDKRVPCTPPPFAQRIDTENWSGTNGENYFFPNLPNGATVKQEEVETETKKDEPVVKRKRMVFGDSARDMTLGDLLNRDMGYRMPKPSKGSASLTLKGLLSSSPSIHLLKKECHHYSNSSPFIGTLMGKKLRNNERRREQRQKKKLEKEAEEKRNLESYSYDFIMKGGSIPVIGLLRPFLCPVPGCRKTYKNVNGLKYHAKKGHRNPVSASASAPQQSST